MRAITLFMIGLLLNTAAQAEIRWDSEGLDCVGRWAEGGGTAICAANGYLYLGYGDYLEVYSLSDPAAPACLGRVLLPDDPRDLVVAGSTVFAALAGGAPNLVTIDVSDPTAPVLLASLGEDWSATGLALEGDRLCVSGRGVGLAIVDVADPAALALLGTFDILGPAFQVALDGNFAYVVSAYYGLHIVDISDPAQAIEVGSYWVSYEPSHSFVDVDISGSVAYIADSMRGLYVLDVADPSDPQLLSATYPPSIGRLTVQGNRAYALEAGLAIFDITNPGSPIVLASIGAGWATTALVVTGDYAYLADQSDRLRVLDVSVPSAPVSVATLPGLGVSRCVAAEEGIACQIGNDGDLQVVDTSNPDAPSLLGGLDLEADFGSSVRAAKLVGTRLYLASRSPDGLLIVDLADPAHPALLGSLAVGTDMPGLDVAGDYAYLACDADGLRIVDVSNPAAPVARGVFDPPGDVLSVAVRNGLAYLAEPGADLRIVNVSNPDAPTELAALNLPGTAGDLVLDEAGETLYLPATDSGNYALLSVDVSVPGAPVQIGTIAIAERILPKAATHGDYAYVGTYTGVLRFDVSDPSAPQAAGYFRLAGRALDLQWTNGLLHVAAAEDGLWLLRDEVLTAVPATPAAAAARLVGLYPNPCNPQAEIRVHVETAAHLRLTVHDLQGRLVRELWVGSRPAGDFAVTWDGKDAVGQAQASGVYLVQLRAGAGSDGQRLVLLR